MYSLHRPHLIVRLSTFQTCQTSVSLLDCSLYFWWSENFLSIPFCLWQHVQYGRTRTHVYSSVQCSIRAAAREFGALLIHRPAWVDQHAGGVLVDTHSTQVPERDGCGWPMWSDSTAAQCRKNPNTFPWKQMLVMSKTWTFFIFKKCWLLSCVASFWIGPAFFALFLPVQEWSGF